jgi:hypothetical protein
MQIDYWTCPQLLISDTVLEFIKTLDFLKDFPNVKLPDYDKISSRFKQAKEYFMCKISEYKLELQMKELGKHG